MRQIYKRVPNKEKEPGFYEITDFKYFLTGEKMLSVNTASSYESDLNIYSEYMKKYRNIINADEIREDDIESYITSLKKNGFSSRTIARKLTAIKAFHEFCFKELRFRDDPSKLISAPKKESHLPEVLTQEEIDLLFQAIDTSNEIGIRNKAIIETLYATGMRISELTELTLAQLHLNQKYLIAYGKGNKERICPLGDPAVKALKDYLTNARPKLTKLNTPLVFVNYKGDHLSRKYIFKYLKELSEKAGINKEISPHTLRHSFATHLVQNDVSLRMVQTMLGHENISTTQIYTHIGNEHLKNVYNTTHPMSKNRKKEG